MIVFSEALDERSERFAARASEVNNGGCGSDKWACYVETRLTHHLILWDRSGQHVFEDSRHLGIEFPLNWRVASISGKRLNVQVRIVLVQLNYSNRIAKEE